MQRLGLIALIVLGMGCIACSGSNDQNGVDHAVESVQQDEPPLYKYSQLRQAMTDSLETIDVFWEHFENPGSEEDAFRVLVAKESKEYARDYVWIHYLQQTGENDWRGSVSLDKESSPRFAPGLSVEFNEDDIVDWAYSEDGRTRGSYTTRAMLELRSVRNLKIDAIRGALHESPTP